MELKTWQNCDHAGNEIAVESGNESEGLTQWECVLVWEEKKTSREGKMSVNTLWIDEDVQSLKAALLSDGE